jgi:acetate---CoA ligase (ADP-forming)
VVVGSLVQGLVPSGVEMVLGVAHDALFGAVVACGAGGTAAELIKDVTVRITPITDLDAAEMVRSLQTFPLLEGYRGAPKADVPALEGLLLRVGAMVDDLGDESPGDRLALLDWLERVSCPWAEARR